MENPPDANRLKYEEFLLAEYDHIAKAHFNTVETIAEFFKHYLLILSVPVTVGLTVLKLFTDHTAPNNAANGKAAMLNSVMIPIGCLLIAFVGFSVMLYIINLRFDALLYARTVNGIRNYFTNRSGISLREEMQSRLLPRSIYSPRYLEYTVFGPVLLACAILNTAYLAFGLYWFQSYVYQIDYLCVSGSLIFVLLHIYFYDWLADYRETAYLRSQIIGIDIDGVLNLHREHFCGIFKTLHNRDIDPSLFTFIPVSEIKGLNISQAEEHAVFNDRNYWSEMPPAPFARDTILRLRNQFHYKIYIFTHRPWPEDHTIHDNTQKRLLKRQWRRTHLWRHKIDSLTVNWLKKHNFQYDRLIVEKGSVHRRHSKSWTNNRFLVSQRKNIQVFVEDDLRKAIKLASICRVVFLISHPYNHDDKTELPNNILRVSGWEEIYRYFRDVF